MTKEALDTLIRHLEVGALIFGVIVVLGVAGESFFGIRIWWNSRKLHEIERAESQQYQLTIAGLQRDTERLKSDAKDTDLKISQADANAKEADARAAVARKEAEGFQAQIAQSKAQAATAEKDAAQAQLDLARYKAHRTLTPEQQIELVRGLSTFRGTQVNVFVFGDTTEIAVISGIVMECMKRSGWQVRSGHVAPGDASVSGIIAGTGHAASQSDASAIGVLVSKLNSFGVASRTIPFEQLPFPQMLLMSSIEKIEAPVNLFIGAKPQ